MKIVMRDSFKHEKDVVVAENVTSYFARLICKELNTSKDKPSNTYFQIVSDEFEVR